MQRFTVLIQCIIFLILLDSKFIFSESHIRAVQISYINVKSYRELNSELKKIKKNNFNTVIFRVFNNRFDRIYPFIPHEKILSDKGVYFKTKLVPVVNDCLKEVIKLCHRNGLKIIAWMETRYADFDTVKDIKKRVVKFDFKKNKFICSKGLSFFNKKNYSFIKKIFFDLLKYNIDGILLQDDLKILVDEDFNYYAIKKFQKITQIKLTEKNANILLYGNTKCRRDIQPTQLYTVWEKIKVKQLKNFLQFLIFNCKTKKNINFFVNINYEASHRPELSRLWYAYDINSFKTANVDYFSVMLYQKQIEKEIGVKNSQLFYFIKNLINNSKKYNVKFIFKIQTFDWFKNKVIKREKIFDLLTFLRKNNIRNIAVFPYYKKLFK